MPKTAEAAGGRRFSVKRNFKVRRKNGNATWFSYLVGVPARRRASRRSRIGRRIEHRSCYFRFCLWIEARIAAGRRYADDHGRRYVLGFSASVEGA